MALDHDSGIESLDSLSPKDMDLTPISSPITLPEQQQPSQPQIQPKIPPMQPPTQESSSSSSSSSSSTSILTSLLSAPSKEPPSSSLVTSLLSVRPSTNNEVKKINVLSINPHNLTLVNEVGAIFELYVLLIDTHFSSTKKEKEKIAGVSFFILKRRR